MGSFCSIQKRRKNQDHPLQCLLKSRRLDALLDMWSPSYLQMLKQKYQAVNPVDGMDHQKFRTLFPQLKSQSTYKHDQETSLHVFQCFDFDCHGRIDYRDLCIMLSLIFNSEDSDRIEVLFIFYDFDQDGKLSKSEMEFLISENQQYLFKTDFFQIEDITLQEFKLWVDANFNLTRYFEIFELIPGPLKERERIREILQQKNSTTSYVISYKWWELWRFYINYNFLNNPKRKVADVSIINLDMEEIEEEKIKYPQQDDQGVQGSQIEEKKEQNPDLELSHGIYDTVNGQQRFLSEENKSLLRPGPIDNSDIQGEYEGELRLNLLNNHDYLILPEAAWISLVQWYGCYNNLAYKRYPFPFKDERLATQTMDLYPPVLSAFMTTAKGEVSFKKSYKIMVSLRKPMQAIVQKLAKKFKIKNTSNCVLYFMKINDTWTEVKDLEQTLLDLEIQSGTFVTLVEKGYFPKSTFPQVGCGLGQLYDVQHPITNEWLLCVVTGFSEDFKTIMFHIQKENYQRDFSIPVIERTSRVYPPHTKQKLVQSIFFIPNHSGLFNLGNTCFINTVVQCLIRTPLFEEYLIKQSFKQEKQKNNKQPLLIEELSKVAIRLAEQKEKVIAPEQFKKAIDHNLPSFSGYEQHDAQEFLNILLDSMSDEIKKFLPKRSVVSSNINNSFDQSETVIKELFTGKTVNTLICQNCQYKSQKVEEFYTLSLPIPLNDEIPIFVVFFRRGQLNTQSLPPLLKYGVKISKYGLLKDLYLAIEKVTGVSMQKFEVAEIYRNQIHKQFANYDTKTTIRQIGLKANQILHAFEIAKIIKDAEDEFQELASIVTYKKEHHVKGDYIDIEDRQGEWRHGQIVNVIDRNMEKSFKVQIKKQSNTQHNILSCHQFQLQPFRSKVPMGKLKFNLVTVINRYFNKATDQFERFSTPFLLIVPTSHLTWFEFQVLIYTQAKRFIDFEYLKKKKQTVKMLKADKSPYNLINPELHYDFQSWRCKNAKSVYLGQVNEVKENSHRKTEQDLEDYKTRHRGPSMQSVEEELNFLKELDFPYKVKILDPQNMNCLTCEKSASGGYNKYNQCDGCEVDPMFLNLSQNYIIALDWIDSLAFNPLSTIPESHESYIQLVENKNNRKDRITPEQCFSILTQQEKVEISCDKCQSKQPSLAQFSLADTPNILILHLKRFQYRDGYLEKIESDIDFPLKSLDLKQWSIEQSKDTVYDLFAVANHFGNGQYGHYTAYVLKNIENREVWVHCDDDQIKHQGSEKVMSQYTYLLFYRRRRIPSSTIVKLTYKN